MKHLQVLEDAGLVRRTKDGRVVSLAIAPEPMQEAAVWLSRYAKFWFARLDALGRYLYHQEGVKSAMQSSATQDRPLINITRHYNASPEKVWRAWIDPQALARWF